MEQNVIKKEHFDKKEGRDLDPNVRQRRAADPESSVWVGASAGTGKTKVLVDRVLRLLLPRPNGAPATPPERILCLTFTKAGASEMALRINKTLGEWAVMEESALQEKLQNLAGKQPDDSDIKTARRLFARVVDTPGRLKIMTIHSFCQSILGRFPLEAGLPPYFTAVDEGPAQELLSQARSRIIASAGREQAKNTPLYRALHVLATEQNEDNFMKTLRNICSERLQLQSILERTKAPEDPQKLYDFIFEQTCLIQGITPENAPQDISDITAAACHDDNFDSAALWSLVKILAEGGKTDQNTSASIQNWLEQDHEGRIKNFENYREAFLTKTDGSPRKGIPCKASQNAHPDSAAIFLTEAQRLIEIDETVKALQCASFTAHLTLFGKTILQEYQRLKEAQAVLDYDDLIDRTRYLLKNCHSAWVMYKLDEGLDHILVDEAQDTNPEQWQIIDALTDDFFSGQGRREEETPTIFTVGDEKQSIYSFQRAAPAEFDRMYHHFAKKVEDSGQIWNPEKLNISFRSTESVLKLVDAVFEPPETRQGLGQDAIEHKSFRRGEEGIVELWPLFNPPEKIEESAWEPPLTIKENPNAQSRLADFIAGQIKGWLDNEELLTSQNRPIRPGDIMILVRSRTTLVPKIVRALKKNDIPVSGADRMVLGEQIAVEDLLALARFALMPADDLTLACVLKTPFIGWDEDKLYNVAIDRQGSLWDSVCASGDQETISYLRNLINEASDAHPYEFFSKILHRRCPADHVSGLRAIRSRLGDDSLDPIDELQNTALSFEHDHLPTLQGFLAWQENNDVTIKRELEDNTDHVRIMTVHGSKGLQAPIVIMPDTTRTSSAKKTPVLLWPDKSGLAFPLWSPKSQYYSQSYNEARAHVEERLDEEYRRLLYVAMTRAEDRLYIGGYTTRQKPIEESWYNHVRKAFTRLNHTEEIDLPGDIGAALRLKNPQTKPLKDRKLLKNDKKSEIITPDWLYKVPKSEAVPPRPLVPSRPEEDEPGTASPLDTDNTYRFRRGNITHKLLEVLPDIAPDKRRNAAELFITRTGQDLPETIRRGIIEETMAILEDPEYGALFGENSMAEVPLTGLIDNKPVSGQIDRLLVTDNEVWIVDYKTNRPPPQKTENIPEIYKTQMKLYSDIVSHIYAEHKIRSFLLWTDGATLMEIPYRD